MGEEERWMDERRMKGAGEGLESVTSTRCSAGGGGGRENKDRDGEIDGSRTGVCGFQCVQSVVASPPQFAETVVSTAHAPRHTLTHTL